jgi:hypothetical protein
MKSSNRQLGRSTQSWIERAKREHQPDVGYNSELRAWLQHVICEAEKDNNLKKRDEFLSLLKDLNAA